MPNDFGTCKNYEPIDPRELANRTGATIEEALGFFDKVFGGYANYVRACDAKDPLCEALHGISQT